MEFNNDKQVGHIVCTAFTIIFFFYYYYYCIATTDKYFFYTYYSTHYTIIKFNCFIIHDKYTEQPQL